MSEYFSISKTINFVAGHRVPSQDLSKIGFNNVPNKCRHIHGHEYKLQVFLGSEKLGEDEMVLDFTFFNYFREFIDKVIDHKFIAYYKDELVWKMLLGINKNDKRFKAFISDISITEKDTLKDKIKTIEINQYPTVVIYDSELYEDDLKNFKFTLTVTADEFHVVLLPFVPTAENLSIYFKNVFQKILPENINIDKILLYETEKAYAQVIF